MTLHPIELIRKKRNGGKLTRDEMESLIRGYLHGEMTDYQMSAFLMAVYFQKMDFEEITALTDVMLRSGEIVDLSSIPGVKVDKHSTGGVGDKVSLILAPMVAACGVPVPMISGRSLGHTGGTLDKLESIPGFRTNLSLNEYKAAIEEVGVVMIGQTAEIAPADKKLYALRDVTGTVESIPLIAGSIMSKKLAEGIDALVLDVKTGHGAFMQSEEKAIELAQTLIAVGRQFGKRTIGFLTDMNQPLGCAVGNWLEVVECIHCLHGEDVPDLMEVTYALGGAMVMLGGKARTIEEGITLCRRAVHTGQAWEKFIQLVERQGGDTSFLETSGKYPRNKFIIEVKSSSVGDIDNIDALEVGYISLMLGAGRTKVDDVIDPKAGIVFSKKVGDSVNVGDTIATLHTDRTDMLEPATHRLQRAISIATEPSVLPPLIHAVVDEEGIHPWHQ
ncbi:MAG: thymidine phosphorylase [Ignavibacteria bacterium]|nr:thymidine phosphorylase [Ignavibacteria bacterium]MBI3765417.1 thymidine phosphorylase [Ignavibacteriales bacterium]